MKLTGVLLLVLGLASTLFRRFDFPEPNNLDFSFLGIEPEPITLLQWMPVVGGILVVIGLGVYLTADYKLKKPKQLPIRRKKVRKDSQSQKLPKNVLYKKGSNVVITRFSLRVGSCVYPLEDIYTCGISTIVPNRKYAILMICLGFVIATMSQLNIIPGNLIPPIMVYGFTLTQVEWMEGVGLLLLTIGLLLLILIPNRYAVQLILGGSAKMDALVSHRKNYTEEIVEALNDVLKRPRPQVMKEAEESSVYH